MPVTGTPAFDGVAVLEMDGVSFITSDVSLTAHAAFVNTKTGKTYGSTTCRSWSKRTLELLQELRSSMEQDVASLVFEAGAGDNALKADAPPFGIREHAGEEPGVSTI